MKDLARGKKIFGENIEKDLTSRILCSIIGMQNDGNSRRKIGMVFERVQEIIAEKLDLDPEEITMESSLDDDLEAT